MRSDTAFFSAAVISRRFLCGLTSGWLSAEAAVAFLGEERRDAERAAGAEAPRSCSTSVSALISRDAAARTRRVARVPTPSRLHHSAWIDVSTTHGCSRAGLIVTCPN